MCFLDSWILACVIACFISVHTNCSLRFLLFFCVSICVAFEFILSRAFYHILNLIWRPNGTKYGGHVEWKKTFTTCIGGMRGSCSSTTAWPRTEDSSRKSAGAATATIRSVSSASEIFFWKSRQTKPTTQMHAAIFQHLTQDNASAGQKTLKAWKKSAEKVSAFLYITRTMHL